MDRRGARTSRADSVLRYAKLPPMPRSEPAPSPTTFFFMPFFVGLGSSFGPTSTSVPHLKLEKKPPDMPASIAPCRSTPSSRVPSSPKRLLLFFAPIAMRAGARAAAGILHTGEPPGRVKEVAAAARSAKLTLMPPDE